ncbi:lipopolysaccharide biosynthesis protein [Deltaproteobacteria bacterium]|nr:lipopolysaccharide biosynthesis protein [Deltaproteobacteria bacterium]
MGNTDYLKEDLKGRSIRGGTINLFGEACKFVLNLGGTAVMARLLTPGDFGLVAMVITVVGFFLLYKDLGLSKATIQIEDIQHHQVNALFWVNVLFSFIILIISWAIAPAIAHVYGEPRLTKITIVIAISFIFGGLTGQFQALMHRHMRFGIINIVETISLMGGLVVGIFSALKGCGYWSLVFKILSEQFLLMAGFWLTCNWRPGKPAFSKEVRSLLQFGGNLTGANILMYLIGNTDKFIIGAFSGAHQLGMYSKAYQFMTLPVQQISLPFTRVVIPALSRLQNDPSKYRTYYRKSLQFMVNFSIPMVVFLWIAADYIVQVFLGPQWLDSVIIFQILGPAALIWSISAVNRWVFVTLGQTDRMLHWGLLAATITILGFLIGVHWGPVGVAASLSITRILLWLPGINYCYKNTPLEFNDLGNALWRPIICSLLAVIVSMFCKSFNFNLVISLKLIISFFIFSFSYMAAWVTLPGGIDHGREVFRLVKELNIFHPSKKIEL